MALFSRASNWPSWVIVWGVSLFIFTQHSAADKVSVTVLSSLDDGSVTFSLSGPANYSVNEGFSTGFYYVPSPDTAGPVAQYRSQSLQGVEDGTIVPFTIFVTSADVVTGEVLRSLVAEYSQDDVFTSSFFEGVQIIPTGPCQVDKSAIDYLTRLDISYLLLSSSISFPQSVLSLVKDKPFKTALVQPQSITPPGPYVGKFNDLGEISVFKVYALFSDYQEAFVTGVTENDDGSYSYIKVFDTPQYAPLIPFPSKLYSSLVDKEKYPLAGLRFALKDLMGVEGIITTGGSRAYARLYDTPANETAPAVQKLMDLGAVLVGKAKLSTFAFGAYPYQHMDYLASSPIFPSERQPAHEGDSIHGIYGPAAAIAAYDQLDFTVGSDTLGSVRNPADRVGCYGIRPSWGAIDLTGVIPSATSLDTLGVFARSATMVQKVMGAWEATENSTLERGDFALPKKIFYPIEFFPVNNSVAQTLIESWLDNMASAMGMTIEYQNVTTLFHENVDQNDTLATYTADFSSLTNYDNWNLFGKGFVQDYQARFDGRRPEADYPVLSAWRSAATYPEYRKQWNEDRLVVFKNFFNDIVIPYNNETCTDGLWVYQIADTGGGVPEYRDVLNDDYFPPFQPMRAASIAPFAKLVDVTVPIGQIPYDSIISLREEQLVMTLSFVAHHGCDAVLMNFITACEAAGFCQEVKTGITAL